MNSLLKTLKQQVSESESNMFEVGEQRERNHRYFSLQPLGNEQVGRSQYISPDVLDAVESKKALFDETFLSNRQTVKFTQSSSAAPGEADAKTAYAMRTLRRNNHEQLFRDGWHDAFVAKREVVVVAWREDTKEVMIDVTGATRQQLPQINMSQGQPLSVDESGLQPAPDGTLSGSITITLDDSYAELKLLQPERYYRDPMATYPGDAEWNGYEEDVSRGTLIRHGYDPEQVDDLKEESRLRSQEEDASRKAHDSSLTQRSGFTQGAREDNQSMVTVFRTWTWLNMAEMAEDLEDDDTGATLTFEASEEIKLYEIHWCAGEILRKKDGGGLCIYEAEEVPFFEWTEVKISHAEHGLCTADIMAHNQKTSSVLKRLIIDNQQMRNNTRYEAAIGALKNPRDLLDGTIGGVVWSRQVGSVVPLATPELSPLTFNVLDMLQRDGERRDGYSGLGKGMNDDALRYQNADSMVERLTNAGTRRPMKAARDWAQTFLIPLCQHIVFLAMRHDKSQSSLEVRGKVIPIVPAQWSDEELSMDTTVALTPEEGKEHAARLLSMHQLLSSDPAFAPIYGLNEKHALIDEVFDAMGISDTTPYMKRPDDPQVQESMKQQQQQMEAEKAKQDQILKDNTDLLKSGDRRSWEAFEWQKTQDLDKANREADKNVREGLESKTSVGLDRAKFAHDSSVDNEEVAQGWVKLGMDRKKANERP